MISFNISVSKRKKFYEALKSGQGFQIMPTRFGFVNYSTYEKMDKENLNIIIHTGYDINIFTNLILQSTYKVNQYLLTYFKLAEKLKIKYVLIHGPDTIEKYNYFSNGLIALLSLIPENIKCVIEMPTFRKSLLDIIDDNYDFILNYFKTCTNKDMFDICLDTAHLYANGLSTDQIIDLMTELDRNFKFIHLNGNLNEVYSKDKHTFILDEKSKLKEVDKLLKYISTLENKICIMEIKNPNYEIYKQMAEEYNLNIVDEYIHDLMC